MKYDKYVISASFGIDAIRDNSSSLAAPADAGEEAGGHDWLSRHRGVMPGTAGASTLIFIMRAYQRCVSVVSRRRDNAELGLLFSKPRPRRGILALREIDLAYRC